MTPDHKKIVAVPQPGVTPPFPTVTRKATAQAQLVEQAERDRWIVLATACRMAAF